MRNSEALDLELRVPLVGLVLMASPAAFFYGLTIAAMVGDGGMGAAAFFGPFGLLVTSVPCWLWRAGTFVDVEGVRIRIFREVSIPWLEVEGFRMVLAPGSRSRRQGILLLRSGGDSIQILGWPTRRFRRNYPRRPKAMMEALVNDLNARREVHAAWRQLDAVVQADDPSQLPP